MLYRIQNLDLPDKPFFVLSPDNILTVDFNSTLFNSGAELLGSYSYPGGTMELEPNQAFIRNAHYISTSIALRTLNAMMWLGDIPFKQVKMNFTIKNRQINYTLYYDIALISNLLKTLKLFQLVGDGNDSQLTFESGADMVAYMTATTTGTKGQYPVVFFPYKNDGAYIEAAYEFEPAYIGTVVYTAGEKFTYTDGHIWEANTTTTPGDNPVSTPLKFDNVTSAYPDNAFPASTIINRWERADDGSGRFIVDTTFPVSQTQTPAFYLVYILKRIAAFFGFEATGNWLNDDDANKIVVWSNIPLLVDTIIPDYTYFMPDILVSDFLKDIRSRFGLLVDPDATRNIWVFESLAFLEDSADVCDLQLLQIQDFEEPDMQSQAYTIEQMFDDKDGAFSDSEKQNPAVMSIGDLSTAMQVTDVQLTDVATKMIQEESAHPVFELTPLVTNWRIPYIKMPIAGATPMDQVSTIGYADRNAFALRFLIYRGMQPDDAGYNYPYATVDNLDPVLNVTNEFSLSLTPANLVLSPIYNYYNYIFNSKPFQMVFEMTPMEFTAIRNNKRIMIRDFNFSTIQCLIDQNAVDFVNNKEKVVAKLNLYPRVLPDNAVEILPPVVIPPPPPPFDNGVVYVKLISTPVLNYISPIPPHYVSLRADLTAAFFADAAMTTPKDVINLDVRLQMTGYDNFTEFETGTTTINCTSTGHEFLLQAGAFTSSNQGANMYLWLYVIASSPNYTVIP